MPGPGEPATASFVSDSRLLPSFALARESVAPADFSGLPESLSVDLSVK